MALNNLSTFDRILLNCQCGENHYIDQAHVHNGSFSNLVERIRARHWQSGTYTASVDEVIRRVKAGTCAVYFKGGNLGGTPILASDLPDPLQYVNFLHPFHANDGWKIRGDFIREVSRDVDSDSGRVDIETQFALSTGRRTPDGTNYAQPLSDWMALPDGTGFRLRLEVPVGDEIGAAIIGTYAPLRAMLYWLASNLQNPATIDATVEDTGSINSQFATRAYNFAQSDTVTIHYVWNSVSYGTANGHVTGFTIHFVPATGGGGTQDHDLNLLNALLDATTQNIPVVADIERVPLGKPDTLLQGNELVLDSEGRSIRFVNDKVIVKGKDLRTNSFYEHVLDPTRSRSIEYDELENELGVGDVATGKKLMPLESHIRTVHFRNQLANGIVKFREPPDHIEHSKGEWDIEVHNANGNTNTCEVQDWDDGNVATLLDKERGGLRVALFGDGNGELVRGTEELVRRREIVGDSPGNMGTLGYWNFDSGHWARPAPIPASVIVNNDEAFAPGTVALGTNVSWPPASILTPESVTIRKDGRLNLDLQIEISVDDSATGASPRSEAILYRQRGTALEVLRSRPVTDLTASETDTWDLSWIGDILSGDIIGLVWVYEKSANLSAALIDVATYKLAMILSQHINKGYSA